MAQQYRDLGKTLVSRDNYADVSRLPLIVCASFLSNPANVGGLCRTVEAFRLEKLVVADFAIAQTSAFKNLAASTQHWQPLAECEPNAVLPWLQNQRQSGYHLIALEADPLLATPITRFVYPQQVVLILGRELTGVPPEILDQCDDRVSIPQLGLVESLNVQTAGAIAIYEYVRQQFIANE